MQISDDLHSLSYPLYRYGISKWSGLFYDLNALDHIYEVLANALRKSTTLPLYFSKVKDLTGFGVKKPAEEYCIGSVYEFYKDKWDSYECNILCKATLNDTERSEFFRNQLTSVTISNFRMHPVAEGVVVEENIFAGTRRRVKAEDYEFHYIDIAVSN